MSIRTSQVLFRVAGARCIWSRPAAESSAKRGWGCGSNQPAAGPERSSGGIGPCWWWEKQGRKGGREGWTEGGAKKKQPHHPPFPLLSLSLFLPEPVTWLCFVAGVDNEPKKSLNYTSCFSNWLFVSHISHWTTAWQSVQVWDISPGCVSALRQYTNNLRSLLDIPEKALPPISRPIEPWQHSINQEEKNNFCTW